MENNIDSIFLGIGIAAVLAAVVSLLWVKAINDTMKNNPNYKGEDWLDWDDDIDEEDKNQIG